MKMTEEMTAYFRSINERFYREKIECKGRIAVIGAGLPPELIYCFDNSPLWILSGTPTEARECDNIPKDADDLSRSVFGLLRSDRINIEDLEAAVILIDDDNSRKLACELREKCRVITVDMPAMYQSDDVNGYWQKSLYGLFEQLKKTVGIKRGSIRRAVSFMNRAREQVRRLVALSRKNPDLIEHGDIMVVVNSLYCCRNKDEWLEKLTALNDSFSDMEENTAVSSDPGVILVGSPVFYPNHKVIRLFRETNIRLLSCIDPVMQIYFDKEMKKKKTDYSQFYSIIKNSIGNITLSGYLETDYTINRLKDEIDATRPNGVIFHVIRGRKTEDADSVNYEKLCEKCGISYFKIETDYQENDIEQLRLRIEAFREILV